MAILFYLLNLIFAGAGFAVARYIWRHKQRGEKLVCPFDADCEAVIHSAYANLLGVPNEALGMVYFVFVFLGYAGVIFFPAWFNNAVVLIGLTAATGLAMAASGFLVYVQAFKIREWCSWCLLSSLISLLIFLSSLGAWTV